jgi:hypothetical protein
MATAGIPTYIRRPRIKTILNQLFHHGTKINDDLTGLDLMHLLISEALERERERGHADSITVRPSMGFMVAIAWRLEESRFLGERRE